MHNTMNYKTLRIVALGSMAMATLPPAVAQENIVPMMRELPQRMELNPAMHSEHGHKFLRVPVLGGFETSVENSGFAYGDLFSWGIDDSLHFDLGRLHDNMRERNLTSVNVDIPLLGFGWKMGESHYGSIVISNKTRSELAFDKSLTKLRHGNWDYDNDCPVDQEVSDIFFRAVNYMEVALGYSNETILDGKVRIGGRMKLLAGVASVQSDDLEVDFKTIREQDRYRVEISSKGSLVTSMPLEVTLDEDGYVDNVEFDDESCDYDAFGNPGIAFDLGVTVSPNDYWTFGLSAIDLGFIKWRTDCHKFKAGASVTMRGVDMSNDIKGGMTGTYNYNNEYWDALSDSIWKFTDLTLEDVGYKTRLSSRLIASAEFKMPSAQWLSFGSVVSTKFADGQAYTRGSVSARLHPARWFSLVGSMALNPGARLSPGVGLSLQSKCFQFFIIADRCTAKISTSTGAAVAWGINFFPGNRKRLKALAAAAEMPAEEESGVED